MGLALAAALNTAATALLAADDRLDALIELTAESGVTDEEACAPVNGGANGTAGKGGQGVSGGWRRAPGPRPVRVASSACHSVREPKAFAAEAARR